MSIQFIVADRNQNDRIGMKWIIEGMDDRFTVLAFVTNSDEMFSALESELPHVIMIELDLFSEEEFIEFKLALKHFRGVLLTFVTKPSFEMGKRAVELRAQEVLQKPVQTHELKNSIRTSARHLHNEAKAPVKTETFSKNEKLTKQILGIDTQNEVEYSMLMFRARNREPSELWHYLQNVAILQQFDYSAVVMEDSVIVMIDRHSTKTYNVPSECLNQWLYKEKNPLVVAYFVSTGKSTYRQGFLACRQAFNHTYFSGLGKVLVANQSVKARESNFPYLQTGEQKMLLDYLQQESTDDFVRWVEGWLYAYESSHKSLMYTRKRAIAAVESIYHELDYSIAKDEETMLRLSQLSQKIDYADHAEEILSISKECFDALVELQEREKSTVSVEIVKSAMNYMKSQYDNPYLTLSDVANVVDRNPSYLGQLFVQYEGGTFRQVLRDIRLEAAMKKLAMTRQTVKHLAFDVGYRDPNYFSRQFKDKTGLSPRAYRDENKKSRP